MNRLCLSLLGGAVLLAGCGPKPAAPPTGSVGSPPGAIPGQGAAGLPGAEYNTSGMAPPGKPTPGRPPGMPPGATLPGRR